jgi:hypothetical protein
MEGKNEKEEDKEQFIKAEKGLFSGLVIIPMIITVSILIGISIVVLKLFNNIYEIIIVIGFSIFLIIVFRIYDNSRIRKKYRK